MRDQKSKGDEFATTLKNCRLKAGLTQKEVAERADLSTSYIALLEAGKRSTPRRNVVKRLANACNINEAFFVRTAKDFINVPLLFTCWDGCNSSPDSAALEMANDTLMAALVKIIECNAPELDYAQIFHKVSGLSLWWKFFIVCLYENTRGEVIISPHEKLHIQEKIAELEKLERWGRCEEIAIDLEGLNIVSRAKLHSTGESHEACYAIWSKEKQDLGMRQAKASKCKPATVSGNRS